MAEALHGLAWVALDRGDLATARAQLRESLATMWRLDARLDVMRCLEGLAALAGAEGRAERALRLDAAAGRLRAALALGQPFLLRRPPPLERALEAGPRLWGPRAADVALAQGRPHRSTKPSPMPSRTSPRGWPRGREAAGGAPPPA